jgi:hypothetical protein
MTAPSTSDFGDHAWAQSAAFRELLEAERRDADRCVAIAFREVPVYTSPEQVIADLGVGGPGSVADAAARMAVRVHVEGSARMAASIETDGAVAALVAPARCVACDDAGCGHCEETSEGYASSDAATALSPAEASAEPELVVARTRSAAGLYPSKVIRSGGSEDSTSATREIETRRVPAGVTAGFSSATRCTRCYGRGWVGSGPLGTFVCPICLDGGR